MADELRIDPLSTFNFYITLIDSSNVAGTLISAALNYFVAGFSECSGIDASIEVIDFKEGGVNDYVHKFATRTSFSNLTLKHGVIFLSDDLWRWHNDWVQGNGKRKDGLIVLLDESRSPAKVWKFKRGIPSKWVGPSLNAAQSNVAIESLEIAHEGLVLEVGA
jgi:phage tail-like protein